ncbi:WASH complex subunit 4 [Culicoides brevitarsis]|uniref:WASH complex subunit 4 n=1 Tax=Culicoides brevitarsis TaxID=469753 RepID=UPI00307BE342
MTSKIDKNALVFSAQLQLKKYGEFLESYSQSLDTLLDQHSNSRKIGSNSICSVVNDDSNEATTLFQIIDSDNKLLSKIIVTFASLFDDCRQIKVEARELQHNFVLMDESLAELETRCSDKSQLKSTCLSHVQFGNVLEMLFRVKYFVEHVTNVICLTLRQLAALFEVEKQYLKVSKSIHFQSVFHHIGELLVIVITFQELLQHASLSNYWQFYKQAINSIKYNTDKFKFDQNGVRGVENILLELEQLLLGDVFEQLLTAVSKIKNETNPKTLGIFSGHVFSYIKTTLYEISRCDSEFHENFEAFNLIKVTSVAVLYHHLFGNLDKSLFRQTIDMNSKFCVVNLLGNQLWLAEKFLNKHVAVLMKGERLTLEIQKNRQSYLTKRNQGISKDVKQYFTAVTLWNINLREILKEKTVKGENIKNLSASILEGVHLGTQISHIIRTTTNLHVFLSVRMSKQTLFSITKLLELLQTIKIIFETCNNDIISSLHYISQHTFYKILTAITNAKQKLNSSSINERHLDIISALQIAEKAFYGAPSVKRMYIGRLALAAADPEKTFDSDSLTAIDKYLRDAENIVKIKTRIDQICDPRFLYWHSSIIPLHLRSIYEANVKIETLPLLIQATNECYERFFAEKREIVSNSTLETFRKDTKSALEKEIMQKLCQEIEIFLRLDYHSNLQLEKYDPFVSSKVFQTMKALAWVEPMKLFGKKILLKDHIEQYLNATYYNLTTISLHDWKTYGEMRKLLNFKFSLTTTADHLPTQTLEQGLDILQIMRNINVFVTKYLYNLNNQIFIEQSSNNKYLNTINITHVANSLRAHGSGIVNTTVNFTYQFLRNKFQVFSQFMFDQHIESRLLKEAKYIKDLADADSKPYPYERADNLSRSIKKLGMSPQGVSYLDMFRSLISQIGNALGYVRMVRSGAIHFTADASTFLPELDENLKFVFLAKENGLSRTTIEAAEDLEANIENISKTYAEGDEYFKLLVDTFAPFFRNPKHIHLKNFYLIIPALTLNYIEHMLTSKDKLTKKDQTGALFTDDGFSIGLAYILKLLDQITDFNALHWFKSLRRKYIAELKELNEKRANQGASNDDEKLQQTFALTEKRITAFQQEFELLFYSLSSAKVFFQ